MQLERTQRILSEYQKTVNRIDDFLEYRYKSRTKDEVRNTILGMIDDLTRHILTKRK